MRSGGGYYRIIGWLAAAAVVVAAPAFAQLSASLSVDSDYRYRGIDLSRDRPALRLDLAYDHPGGAYGGVSLIGMRDTPYGDIGVSYIGYAGYVWQPSAGPSWEAGVADTHIHNGANYDFAEVYGGLATRAFTVRVHYAPDYYGSHARTLYSEFDASRRLAPMWRAFLHAGTLTPVSGERRRERYDLRAGLALSLSPYEIQAAWSRSNPLPGYATHRPDGGNALVLSATRFF